MDSQQMVDDFCGTPGCFAPELITQPRWNPILADRWSVGCILLQLLVGDSLFHQKWVSAYRKTLFDDPSAFSMSLENAKENIQDNILLSAKRGHITEARNMSNENLLSIITHLFSMLHDAPNERISPSESLQQPWLYLNNKTLIMNSIVNNFSNECGSSKSINTLPSGISSRGTVETNDDSSALSPSTPPLVAIVGSRPVPTLTTTTVNDNNNSNNNNNSFNPKPPSERRTSFPNSPLENRIRLMLNDK